ncbi:MAG: hypothetical protein HYS05_20575 [Acidobacteria bacterium]|nr:hypothetical protein [Acidobacteriota bacterium]
MKVLLAVVVLATILTSAAWAQRPLSGNVSFTLDHFPNAPSAPSGVVPTASGATEIRIRLFADSAVKRGVLTLRAAGYVEGLVADRMIGDTSRGAIVRPQELYAELAGRTVDFRAGFSRIVWGRLDELQPGDAINPLDLSKFFFEGRSAARLPVLVFRGRWHFGEGGTLEGVLLPRFQPGHFDQLDENSSPFNLVPREVCGQGPTSSFAPVCVRPAVRVEEPAAAWRNLQGGARVSATTGRVDWAVAAFRGFEALPLYRVELRPIAGIIFPTLIGSHPRTSMIAGDFESVLGQWGIRGEVAAFVEDHFQAGDATGVVGGHSIQSGAGVDRTSGSYRFTASVLVDYRTAGPAESPRDDDGPAGVGRHKDRDTDLTLVGSAERPFARETRVLRGLALYNVSEGTAFLRAVAAASVRDNLWLEASGGLFVGEGDDVVGLFRDRDFLYARVKYYF